jgi:serine/threonine protein kinase
MARMVDRTPDPEAGKDTPVPAGSRPDLLIGQLVADKYRVIELVARGGMGRIYKAEQHGRVVALKVLSTRYAAETDPAFERRFLQEAATCAKLTHPNTVRIFDYGPMKDGNGEPTLFMVMEFIEGRTLSALLRGEGPLPEARAVGIAREIARSLREAHRLGIVHRDLKPKNIMLVQVDERERVKVVDFGIAKVLGDDNPGLTSTQNIVGSPRYMAPEQIRHGAIDGRTDLYALGVVLYEMLAGSVPFDSTKTVDLLIQHIQADVPSIAGRRGVAIDPRLDALVLKCLAKDPTDRFPDVEALIAALDELGLVDAAVATTDRSGTVPVDPSTEASSSSTTLAVPAPALPRRVGVAAVATTAVLALLLVTSLGVWAFSGGPDSGTAIGSVPAAPPPPVPAVLAPVPAVEAPIALHLTSTPPGAQVWEGNRMYGNTPFDVPLDRHVHTPRTFTLRLDGFVPFEVVQAPTAADAVQDATLVAVPAAAPLPPRPPRAPVPPKPPPPTDDIKGAR